MAPPDIWNKELAWLLSTFPVSLLERLSFSVNRINEYLDNNSTEFDTFHRNLACSIEIIVFGHLKISKDKAEHTNRGKNPLNNSMFLPNKVRCLGHMTRRALSCSSEAGRGVQFSSWLAFYTLPRGRHLLSNSDFPQPVQRVMLP